jgi:hypothetical protein
MRLNNAKTPAQRLYPISARLLTKNAIEHLLNAKFTQNNINAYIDHVMFLQKKNTNAFNFTKFIEKYRRNDRNNVD